MAIEMIEDNELAALSVSRIGGSKFFVDDNAYSNLFGSKTADRNRQIRMDEIRKKYAIDPKFQSNCEYLSQRLTEATNELEKFRKTFKGRVEQAYIDALEGVVSDYRTLISNNKCEEKKKQAETEQQKKETLDILQTVTNTPPPLIPAETDSSGNPKSNITNYIIYGVGAVVFAVALGLLFKK